MFCESVTVIGFMVYRGTGEYVGDMPCIVGGGVGVLAERLWSFMKKGLYPGEGAMVAGADSGSG